MPRIRHRLGILYHSNAGCCLRFRQHHISCIAIPTPQLRKILQVVVPRATCAHEVHAYEMHAREVHAREVHAHEMHANVVHGHNVHTREVHSMRCTPM